MNLSKQNVIYSESEDARVYANKEKQITEYLIENQAKFYRLSYSYMCNKEDALDVVQESVCKALENAGRLRNIEAVRTWFYRILVHECMNRLRARGRESSAPDEVLDSAVYDLPFSDDLLYRKVQMLPHEIRTVIQLRFYEEFSLKEISETTGWKLNTVKTRLYSGLRKLRMGMEGVEIDE